MAETADNPPDLFRTVDRKARIYQSTVPSGSKPRLPPPLLGNMELRAKLLKDGNWNGELRQKTKSGREITVESRIVLEVIDGRRLALESTHDITDRKLWEQRQ